MCNPSNTMTQCGFLSQCIQNVSSGNYSCQTFYSIPNGVQISFSTPTRFCMSNYTATYNGQNYCMPAPKSTYDPTVGIPNIGTNCTYMVWNNASNLSMVTYVNGTNSYCGYASNGLSYCDQRQGDNLATLVLNNIQVGLTRTILSMCNPLSTMLTCAAWIKQVPSTFIGNTVKASLAIIPGANALYQLNDQCTIADLTSNYWMYGSFSAK